MVSFTIDSSIDGTVHIFGPNRSIFVRIFWICLLILSVYGLIYYIHGSYVKWLIDPDIIEKHEVIEFRQHLSYVVTICPQQFDLNLLGKISEIKKKVEEGKEKFVMSREDCAVLDVYDKWCIAANKTLNMTNRFDSFVKDGWKSECKAEDLSRNRSEVASILFKARSRSETGVVHTKDYGENETVEINNYHNSSSVFTSFGACTSIDMPKKSMFKEKWMDEAYGLIKDGEVESNWTFDADHYPPEGYGGNLHVAILGAINHSCNGSSYRVIIHQPDEIPTRYHETIDVEYETWTFVYHRISSFRSSENLRVLGPDVRKCYFEDEGRLKYFKRYSQKYCKLECHAEANGCHPIEVPRKETDKDFCNAKLHGEFDERDQKYKKCKCYPNCNFMRYELSKEVNDYVWHKSAPNLAQFYYYNAAVSETERFIAFTLANFIADTGGYLGLFLGCSLLSIIEILFYIACKIYNWIRKREDHDDTPNLKEMAREVKFFCAKVEQMQKEWNEEQDLSNEQFDEHHHCNDVIKQLQIEVIEMQEVLVKLLEKGQQQTKNFNLKLHEDQQNEPCSRDASRNANLNVELLKMIAEDRE